MEASQLAGVLRNSIADRERPLVCAIAGAAALGKTTVAKELAKQISTIDREAVSLLSTDGFLPNRQDRARKQVSGYDWVALDIDRLRLAVAMLLSGRPIRVPVYDHSEGSILADNKLVYPADVLIIEGAHSFEPRILESVDYAVFFDSGSNDSINLRRRVDVQERGYTSEEANETALVEYCQYQRHIAPLRASADVVITVFGSWKYELQHVDK